MKKKSVVLFMCMLVIATIVPATGTHDEKTISSTRGIDFVPVLNLTGIQGGFLGVSVVVKNFGVGIAENIRWEMAASGGLLFFPKSRTGTIDMLYPGDAVPIKVWPALGLGKTTITFYCIYRIVNLSYDVDFEVKQEWRDQTFIFWHSFDTTQPTKEWRVIYNFSYFEKTGTPGVQFQYGGIDNMHNVRVVLGLPSCSQEVQFLAACKFTNGSATLYECWLTRELVQGGDAHWEVELVDGG
jgi:hypothetical protein